MWSEAGDDPGKYEDAIGIIRKAEEELASAEGKSS
jgi:hypothetical protein